MDIDRELLQKLTQAWAVSGREKGLRALIRQECQPYADGITTDALGNLIVFKKGARPREGKTLMLCAHMDEIGGQVTRIESDGRIGFCTVGWLWAAAMYNDKVIFPNGTVGVVGCEGQVEDAKNDVTRLFVDIGCKTREETEAFVQVGDYFGFIGPFYPLQNNCVCTKSLDDRIGCYLLIQDLKRNDGSRPNDLYYVFSVQEEVGCRGAQAAAQRILPDIGLSVDVTPDHFYPCDLKGMNAVGAGVGVKLGDPSAMLDETLVEEMLQCCRENGIRYQRDVMDRGGTDASAINLSGCGIRVAGLSIVTRYPHSQSAVISLEDVEEAQKLMEKYTARIFRFEE